MFFFVAGNDPAAWPVSSSMKLPQHPTMPLLSVALFSYLCGDLTCAIMGRRFSDRPQSLHPSQLTAAAPDGPTNPGELMALLKAHRQLAPTPAPQPTSGPDQPSERVVLPTLVGTLEGQGRALALLQAQGSQETVVVAVGEDFQGFTVTEVGAFQARLRAADQQEHTVSMGMAGSLNTPPPPPALSEETVEPYRTSRQLRQDIDNKEAWIDQVLIKPSPRQGVLIQHRGRANPFARLGILSGDVVLALNNRPARSMDDLPGLLLELRNAQTLVFQLQRNGQPTTLTVELQP